MKRTHIEDANVATTKHQKQQVDHEDNCNCFICLSWKSQKINTFTRAMKRLVKWNCYEMYSLAQKQKFKTTLSLAFCDEPFTPVLIQQTKNYLWDAFFKERFAVSCFVLQHTLPKDLPIFQQWLLGKFGTSKIKSIYNVALFYRSIRESDELNLIALLWATSDNTTDKNKFPMQEKFQPLLD